MTEFLEKNKRVLVVFSLLLGLLTPAVVKSGLFDSNVHNSDDIDFLGHVSVRSDVFEVRDQLDSTKKLKFNASGITTATTRTITLPDASGTLALTSGSTFTNATITDPTLTRTSQKKVYSSFARAGTTSGWLAGDNIANNLANMATLAEGNTSSTLVIPLSGLKVGDVITGFHLIGNIVSSGTAGTLDADLRYETAAAAAPNDADLGTMTQVSATSNTKLSSSNTTRTLASSHTVAADETYYLLLTATTGAGASMVIQGAALSYTEH